MVELKNISKIYKSKKSVSTIALNDINIKIQNQGMIFIVGKSGSGKTTLLNIIGGLDSPTAGEININGRNISNFKNDEYDSYRNTYVGFVFQEFNILEQYNVYENIELSLKLQNQKKSRKEIDSLLNKLGIANLGNRKINELSGGQKQRVAIARALIKNPKIILADEPTGNLDQKSSEQIFDILKEISNDKLVIVVSHDMESAKKYASRIIEISDGKILYDSKPCNEITIDNFELKKSSLPFLYAFKMALNSFKAKPFKLFMTILLTTISLIFMGFTINCSLFDKTMLVTETMKNNNNYNYDIYKTEYGYMGSMSDLMINENDLEKIKKINSNINIAYTLYDNGNLLDFEFGTNDKEDKYYNFDLSKFNFIEISDERILGKLIGKSPQNNNEIVVSKYFADYAIKFGIMSCDNKLYFPKDYTEIISDKKKIKLGNNAVVITGIIDEDDSLYKTSKLNKNFTSDKLYNYFYDTYAYNAHNIYVKGFTKDVNLNINKYSILNKSAIHGGIKNETFISENIRTLENSIKIIAEQGIKTISTLTKEEIIVSVSSIKKFDKEFDSKFNEYLSTQKNKTYDESLKEFVKKYLNENSLDVKLSIYLGDVLENNSINTSTKIVGVSLDGYNYISYSYIKEYNPVLKKVYSVKVYEDDIAKLTKSLNNLKFKNSFNFQEEKTGIYYTYMPNIDHSFDLANIMGFYKNLATYILIISLIFVLFTFLLFSNFIALSISYCKKEIGILRAIGASAKDVIKIFGYESIIIAIISWILSIIGWVITCNILNESMFGENYYILNGIITHPLVPIIMFTYTLAIAILITLISINKIVKIKPIDAILNK